MPWSIDLALIKLSTPIERIEPVKLYESEMCVGQKGYIVGYGYYGKNSDPVKQPSRVRHFGTVKLTSVDDSYLRKSIIPTWCEKNWPRGFQSLKEDGLHQAIAVEGDSGSPFLLGKIKEKTLYVEGIFHGVEGFELEGRVVHMEDQWIPIYPHLDWLKSNII
ncbi:MAG: trypsin-like serine protease [Pseudomonadota bacterium]